MTKLACPSCGTTDNRPGLNLTPEQCACDCGGTMVQPWKLKPRKPLRRVSEKRQGETRRRGSTLKRGRGFAASPAQQAKIRDLACIVCGRDRHEAKIEAAHVYPRRLASCDCAEGVVALCHEDHRAFDEGKLDLLPALIAHGYRAEVAHAFLEHDAPFAEVLKQVTGVSWKPVAEAAA